MLIGVIDKDEYEARKREQQRKFEERYEAEQRRVYEELKKKFGGI